MNLEDFLRHLPNSGICQNFARHAAPVKTPLNEMATLHSKTKRTHVLNEAVYLNYL